MAVFTRGLTPTRGAIAGIALAPEVGRGFYLPFGHEAAMSLALGDVEDGRTPNLPPLSDPVLASVRELLADPSVEKIGHDLKASIVALSRADLELGGPCRDVMVASYVLDPSRRQHDLAALATDFLGFELAPLSKVLGTGKKRLA
ncbi:MAG: hypothetical protein GWN18_18955, partial [Thermoplasmata archaeon]|nr:hypothetical protein [Thermoplasmata archaeon]NIW84590.1 hypothetical protein [Thermoplasmata archaeon]NIW90915.1 hypothetical protein [Thermoplasmata archaeon]